MKKIEIITCLLIMCLWSNLVKADPAAMLQCKITLQAVTIIKDGKAEIFGGVSGGPQIGDELLINIKLIKYPQTSALKVDITPAKFDLNLTMGEATYVPDKVEGDFLGFPNLITFDGGGFGTDEITFPNVLGSLRLERYYKSDWHGFLSIHRHRIHKSLALDCRTNGTSIEGLLTELKSRGF